MSAPSNITIIAHGPVNVIPSGNSVVATPSYVASPASSPSLIPVDPSKLYRLVCVAPRPQDMHNVPTGI